MACAEKILSIEGVSAKFASHNAHTIAAINEMAKGKEFEYQRLYGMGELLYKKADEVFSSNYKTSIYAPIGKYKDLLPYLVRRLLENGANSSFINRLLDPETDSLWLADSPVKKISEETKEIPLPKNIFSDRKNSTGIDLSEALALEEINNKLSNFDDSKIVVESIYSSRRSKAAKSKSAYSLATNREIGEVAFDSNDDIEAAFSSYKLSEWGSTCVTERADILNNIASSLEDDHMRKFFII